MISSETGTNYLLYYLGLDPIENLGPTQRLNQIYVSSLFYIEKLLSVG